MVSASETMRYLCYLWLGGALPSHCMVLRQSTYPGPGLPIRDIQSILVDQTIQSCLLIGWQHFHHLIRNHVRYILCLTWTSAWILLWSRPQGCAAMEAYSTVLTPISPQSWLIMVICYMVHHWPWTLCHGQDNFDLLLHGSVSFRWLSARLQ